MRWKQWASGDGVLLLTALIWGINFPVSKHVLGTMPPMLYASARYFSAALLLLGLLQWRRGSIALPWRELLPLAGIGLIGITIFQSLWANALTLTTASKAAILVSLTPVWTALFATFAGKRPSNRALFGMLLSFLGVFLVINNSLTQFNLVGGSLTGDLMFLAIGGLWATYSAVAPPYLARLGPLPVTAWAMFIGAALLLPFGALQLDQFDATAAAPSIWVGFAFASILAAGLGFLWWYEGVRRLGVTRAVVYSYMIPVFAVASAVLFLDEPFSLVQLGGALIVLAGIWLTRKT